MDYSLVGWGAACVGPVTWVTGSLWVRRTRLGRSVASQRELRAGQGGQDDLVELVTVQDHADRLQRVGHADLAARVGAQRPEPRERLAELLAREHAPEILSGPVCVDLVGLVLQLLPGRQAVVVARLGAGRDPHVFWHASNVLLVELAGRGRGHQDVEVAGARPHALLHACQQLVAAEGLVRHHEVPTHDHHLHQGLRYPGA